MMSAHRRGGQALCEPLTVGQVEVVSGQLVEADMAEVAGDAAVEPAGVVAIRLGAQVRLDMWEVLLDEVPAESRSSRSRQTPAPRSDIVPFTPKRATSF